MSETTETLPVPPKTKPTTVAPMPKAPEAEVNPALHTVRLVNKMRQALGLNVPDKTGKLVGIELSSLEKRPWTYLGDNLGPDFAVKRRKGLITLA